MRDKRRRNRESIAVDTAASDRRELGLSELLIYFIYLFIYDTAITAHLLLTGEALITELLDLTQRTRLLHLILLLIRIAVRERQKMRPIVTPPPMGSGVL